MATQAKSRSVVLISSESVLDRALRELQPEVSVRRFATGREAMDHLAETEPSLIVADFQQTDMTGRDLFLSLQHDKRFSSQQNASFILFSAGEESRSRYGQELFDLGLCGWYVLPMDSDAVVDIFYNHLRMQAGTARSRQLQQEVKRSEFRYRDLLENAVDFIFTLDAEGHFLYLNNRFNSLMHHGKENWTGKPFLSIVDPKYHDAASEQYHMAQQGRARVFEAKIACPDAHCPVLSFSITPIVEHGKIVGSIGIGRDVAEQKKMEQEILDLKNFNESIIESMEAGLLTMDLGLSVTSINTGGQKILGWKAEEILGKPIHLMLKSDEVDSLLSDPHNPETPSFRRETQLTLKSGKSVSIGFTVTDRVDNQHNKVGTIISFRDITQLKQMQAEVIRMDRLASLGVLASGIAHEIKNPLAGIKALAQACEEDLEPDDSRREYLVRITRQVNRLDELLRTFFTYARPKPPDRKHTKVSDILGEVLHLLNKKMHNHRIDILQELPEPLPPVWADFQQMQQVFLNLFLNAIDSMPDGGSLRVRAAVVQAPNAGLIRRHFQRPDVLRRPFVQTMIQDTGIGIPTDKLETIFDPFFTTKPNGLGLGLSIVYRIIDEHGGDLHVESQVGTGTTFTITLPTGAIS
jgi:PAS domain S-box-containing protein